MYGHHSIYNEPSIKQKKDSIMVATFPTPTQISSNLPYISGEESNIQAIANNDAPVFLSTTNLKLADINAGFACALHMHQPTIPAGQNGSLISHLQYMYEHSGEGDNHNADPFAWCYRRMGEFIPQLIQEGCNPRIMLDYSGNLLWGFQQMGRNDILDNLKNIELFYFLVAKYFSLHVRTQVCYEKKYLYVHFLAQLACGFAWICEYLHASCIQHF